METKTLVVDIDDTISTHINRNYTMSIPNKPIIDRLNLLYDSGWKIIYFTARGQYSCDGDLKLIELLRRQELTNWMTLHNVKHHELRFGKPLAIYYIDDKALRPDEFMSMPIDTFMGGSNASVQRLGKRVIKIADNAAEQAAWYRLAAKMYINVPHVYDCYGNTLNMEFIDGLSFNFEFNKTNLTQLLSQVDAFSNIKASNSSTWEQSMVPRIIKHLLNNNKLTCEYSVIKIITDSHLIADMNKNQSFCHGDLTFENIIVTAGGDLCLIDPNCPAGLFQSYLLDFGKILQSLRFMYEETISKSKVLYKSDYINEKRVMYEFIKNEINEVLGPRIWYLTQVCELIHYIRLLKYASFDKQQLVKNNIEILHSEIVATSCS